MRKAESNPTHYAMAALQKMGYVSSIITVSLLTSRSHIKKNLAHTRQLPNWLGNADIVSSRA